MFGVDGFKDAHLLAKIRLHPLRPREAVGIGMTEDGVVLARLSASDEADGGWMVTASHTAACACAPTDASSLAAAVRAALSSQGWERLPLGLALPAGLAVTAERELPAALTGEDLRAALLWAMRAEADAEGRTLPAALRLCCCARTDAEPYRYWSAVMEDARVQAYFAAFSHAGMRLRRLTVCPPAGGALAPLIAVACRPQMSWECQEMRADLSEAVYAGLLVSMRSSSLSWCEERNIVQRIRSHAAEVIAAAAAACFLMAVSTDAAVLIADRAAADAVREELGHADADVHRMEIYAAQRADVTRREQILAEFQASAHPLRAFLVFLGTVTADGVHLTALRAYETVEIEGEAADYDALHALVERVDAGGFFSGHVVLAEVSRDEEGVRCVLRADWKGV